MCVTCYLSLYNTAIKLLWYNKTFPAGGPIWRGGDSSEPASRLRPSYFPDLSSTQGRWWSLTSRGKLWWVSAPSHLFWTFTISQTDTDCLPLCQKCNINALLAHPLIAPYPHSASWDFCLLDNRSQMRSKKLNCIIVASQDKGTLVFIRQLLIIITISQDMHLRIITCGTYLITII